MVLAEVSAVYGGVGVWGGGVGSEEVGAGGGAVVVEGTEVMGCDGSGIEAIRPERSKSSFCI